MLQNLLELNSSERLFKKRLAGAVIMLIGAAAIIYAQEEIKEEITKNIVTIAGAIVIVLGGVVAGNLCQTRGSESLLTVGHGNTYLSFDLEHATIQEETTGLVPAELETEAKGEGLSSYTPGARITGRND